MSDLISRQALLNELKEYVEFVYKCDFDDTYCTADGGSLNPKYVQGLWEVKEIIQGHPTAYDVEKVVEQLESFPKLEVTQFPLHGSYLKKDAVMRIVKGGGVDE